MHYGPPPIFPDSLRIRRARRIAIGGMAQVYLAERELPGGVKQPVVAKYMLPQFADDPEFVSRFRDEARIGLLLRHGNIVRVLDYAEVENRHLIIMEFIDGCDLRDVMGSRRTGRQQFPHVVAAQFALGLSSALAYIAETKGPDGKPLNIVHRDISPTNVLVSSRGVVKLADFGVAKGEHRETGPTQAGFFGKYAYMSPEQILGEELDARSDLFSVGCVLYEMLAGHRPFRGRTDWEVLKKVVHEPPQHLRDTRTDVDPELEGIVMRCLAREPGDRWETPFQLTEALHRFLLYRAKEPPILHIVKYLEYRGLSTSAHTLGPDLEGEDLSLELQTMEELESPSYVRSLSQSPMRSFELGPAPTSSMSLEAAGPITLQPTLETVDPDDARAAQAVQSVTVEPRGEAASAATPSAATPTPDPTPPPRKRSRGPLLIAVVVVGVLLAVGLGVGAALLVPALLSDRDPDPVVLEGHNRGRPPPPEIVIEDAEDAGGDAAADAQPKPPPPGVDPPPPADAAGASAGRGNGKATDDAPPEPADTAGKMGTGYVTVESRPWARVTIAGTAAGTTPVRRHAVSPGPIEVEIHNPDTGWRESRSVTVAAGEETVVRFKQK